VNGADQRFIFTQDAGRSYHGVSARQVEPRPRCRTRAAM